MEEENLSFAHYTPSIVKRFWIIVLFTLVAGLTSAYISYFVINPVYQAEVNLLVTIVANEKKTPHSLLILTTL